jgi:hypothetical protein
MAVAKSLARMTAELVGAHAQHASETLRVYAGAAMTEVAGSVALGVASGEERLRVHVQKLQRIARATAASAAHAAQASEARRTRPRKPRDESVGTTTDAGEPDDE